MVEELYLVALGRKPRPEETASMLGYIAGQKDRRAAYEDALLALLNTKDPCLSIENGYDAFLLPTLLRSVAKHTDYNLPRENRTCCRSLVVDIRAATA